MAYSAGILLGKIIKSYGFDGALTIKTETGFEGNIPEMESVFLETDGKLVPFLVSSYEFVDNSLIRVTFDGYDSLGKVRGFIGSKVFLTSAIKTEDPEDDLNRFKGYRISTTCNDHLGTISEIIENPGQILLDVQTPRDEKILIPFHQDLIVRIDKRRKVITMDLPEGLMEINE